MLPLVLLLSDVYRAIGKPRQASRELAKMFSVYLAYTVVIICYFSMRWFLYAHPFLINPAHFDFVVNPIAALPFYLRFLTAMKVWG